MNATTPVSSDPNINADLSARTQAIDRAQSLLQLTDEDGNAPVNADALSRAADFLRRSIVRSRATFQRQMQIPAIRPGPDGSIDLHWRTGEFETLVNVPAETSRPIDFYGDDHAGNWIKGSLISDDNGGLVLWLTMNH